MRVAIIALGTRGDVQPVVALGLGLQAAGYTVRVVASKNFEHLITGYGLEYGLIRTDVQAMLSGSDGHEWLESGRNPLSYMKTTKRLLAEHGWEMVQDAWTACQGADAIFSSFTSDVFAVTIAEKMGVPHFRAPLQPLVPTQQGASTSAVVFPRHSSRINYWMGQFAETMIWTFFGDLSNRLRTERLGLPALSKRAFFAGLYRAPVVHGFSPSVVPRAPEWGTDIHTAGYWFLDDRDGWQPSPELSDFLAAGSPPVYFGFGSMTNRDPAQLTSILLEALRQSGQRGLLLTGWGGISQRDLPDNVLMIDSAPHSWLFPRMAAVVHHGGAGTTAAGLRAGVPSLIIPHFGDQMFWGARVGVL
ncbi:MAG: glycosyltransferase, partial [Anaerolineae bacterium]|nr:glycosyltransferase [Anaerolineae bacterium]